MDAHQFQQLLQGLAQQESDRVTRVAQLEHDRNTRHVQQDGTRTSTQAIREKVKNLIHQTTPCDGSSTANVRMWIREVTLAASQVGEQSVIEIATRTITGPFRFEAERFIERAIAADDISRAAITWNSLRDHLSAQFLNVDEAAALRDEVETVRQPAFETTAKYSRRFREVADAAYPQQYRNEDQERILVNTYARGLKSDDMARKLVEETAPATLEAAITAVAKLNERQDAYTRLRRVEEPMEVGIVHSTQPTTSHKPPVSSTEDALVRTMDKLATKLAKIEASLRSPAPDRRPDDTYKKRERSYNRPTPRYEEVRARSVPRRTEGRPDRQESRSSRPQGQQVRLCYTCGKPGHIARECRQSKPASGNGQPS